MRVGKRILIFNSEVNKHKINKKQFWINSFHHLKLSCFFFPLLKIHRQPLVVFSNVHINSSERKRAIQYVFLVEISKEPASIIFKKEL